MNRIITIAGILAIALGLHAQDTALPQPMTKAGTDLLPAIQNRRASKVFVKKTVSQQELATILWAGLGLRGTDAVSSATKAGRNVSFSGENPYINIYLLTEKGTWKYLPETNTLKFIGADDSRVLVSKAAAVNASFMVLFTVDTALTPSFLKSNPALFMQMAHATAGFAAQNMSLTGSALKLATIIQYSLTPAEAAKAAGLSKEEVPLFIMQGGYTE